MTGCPASLKFLKNQNFFSLTKIQNEKWKFLKNALIISHLFLFFCFFIFLSILKILKCVLYHTIPTFNNPKEEGFKKTVERGYTAGKHTIPTLNNPKEEGFKKTVERGYTAGKQHFLLFAQCFLHYQRERSSFINF